MLFMNSVKYIIYLINGEEYLESEAWIELKARKSEDGQQQHHHFERFEAQIKMIWMLV